MTEAFYINIIHSSHSCFSECCNLPGHLILLLSTLEAKWEAICHLIPTLRSLKHSADTPSPPHELPSLRLQG